MRAGPDRLRRNDLPKAAYARHFRRFDHEIRVEGEESNEDYNDDANDQAEQERWANDRRPLTMQNKFLGWLITHFKLFRQSVPLAKFQIYFQHVDELLAC